MATFGPDVKSADGSVEHLGQVMEDAKDALARFKVTDASSLPPVDCDLAVHVDSLTEDEVKEEIEDATHILVAGTLRQLEKITDIDYDKVDAMMSTNSLAEPDATASVIVSERYMKSGDKSKFLVDGKPSPTLLKDISSWVTRTIKDKKVIAELKLDVGLLGRIISAASISIDWLAKLTGETTYKERQIVNLGVLRFPDEVNEYFQLYKIEISAYIDVSREVFEMVDKNGIYLKYQSKRFIPRESVMGHLKEETKTKAVAESVAFYTSKPTAPKKKVLPRQDLKWPTVFLDHNIELPSVNKVLRDAQESLSKFGMDSEATPVSCKLSVAFDDLTKSEITKMGDYAKMLVYVVNKSLKKLSGAEVSYDAVKSILSNISVMKSIGTDINSKIIEKTYENRKFPKPNEEIKADVKNWLKKLINDAEIMEDLQGLLNAGALTKCLVTAGEHMSFMEKAQGSHKYKANEIVDLTVLRFPDKTREYFHLYHIGIKAYTDSTREMIDEVDKCGLIGDIQSIKYGPRESVLQRMPKSIVERVVGTIDEFYTA